MGESGAGGRSFASLRMTGASLGMTQEAVREEGGEPAAAGLGQVAIHPAGW
jgi:hypothetical protein